MVSVSMLMNFSWRQSILFREVLSMSSMKVILLNTISVYGFFVIPQDVAEEISDVIPEEQAAVVSDVEQSDVEQPHQEKHQSHQEKHATVKSTISMDVQKEQTGGNYTTPGAILLGEEKHKAIEKHYLASSSKILDNVVVESVYKDVLSNYVEKHINNNYVEKHIDNVENRGTGSEERKTSTSSVTDGDEYLINHSKYPTKGDVYLLSDENHVISVENPVISDETRFISDENSIINNEHRVINGGDYVVEAEERDYVGGGEEQPIDKGNEFFTAESHVSKGEFESDHSVKEQQPTQENSYTKTDRKSVSQRGQGRGALRRTMDKAFRGKSEINSIMNTATTRNDATSRISPATISSAITSTSVDGTDIYGLAIENIYGLDKGDIAALDGAKSLLNFKSKAPQSVLQTDETGEMDFIGEDKKSLLSRHGKSFLDVRRVVSSSSTTSQIRTWRPVMRDIIYQHRGSCFSHGAAHVIRALLHPETYNWAIKQIKEYHETLVLIEVVEAILTDERGTKAQLPNVVSLSQDEAIRVLEKHSAPRERSKLEERIEKYRVSIIYESILVKAYFNAGYDFDGATRRVSEERRKLVPNYGMPKPITRADQAKSILSRIAGLLDPIDYNEAVEHIYEIEKAAQSEQKRGTRALHHIGSPNYDGHAYEVSVDELLHDIIAVWFVRLRELQEYCNTQPHANAASCLYNIQNALRKDRGNEIHSITERSRSRGGNFLWVLSWLYQLLDEKGRLRQGALSSRDYLLSTKTQLSKIYDERLEDAEEYHAKSLIDLLPHIAVCVGGPGAAGLGICRGPGWVSRYEKEMKTSINPISDNIPENILQRNLELPAYVTELQEINQRLQPGAIARVLPKSTSDKLGADKQDDHFRDRMLRLWNLEKTMAEPESRLFNILGKAGAKNKDGLQPLIRHLNFHAERKHILRTEQADLEKMMDRLYQPVQKRIMNDLLGLGAPGRDGDDDDPRGQPWAWGLPILMKEVQERKEPMGSIGGTPTAISIWKKPSGEMQMNTGLVKCSDLTSSELSSIQAGIPLYTSTYHKILESQAFSEEWWRKRQLISAMQMSPASSPGTRFVGANPGDILPSVLVTGSASKTGPTNRRRDAIGPIVGSADDLKIDHSIAASCYCDLKDPGNSCNNDAYTEVLSDTISPVTIMPGSSMVIRLKDSFGFHEQDMMLHSVMCFAYAVGAWTRTGPGSGYDDRQVLTFENVREFRGYYFDRRFMVEYFEKEGVFTVLFNQAKYLNRAESGHGRFELLQEKQNRKGVQYVKEREEQAQQSKMSKTITSGTDRIALANNALAALGQLIARAYQQGGGIAPYQEDGRLAPKMSATDHYKQVCEAFRKAEWIFGRHLSTTNEVIENLCAAVDLYLSRPYLWFDEMVVMIMFHLKLVMLSSVENSVPSEARESLAKIDLLYELARLGFSRVIEFLYNWKRKFAPDENIFGNTLDISNSVLHVAIVQGHHRVIRVLAQEWVQQGDNLSAERDNPLTKAVQRKSPSTSPMIEYTSPIKEYISNISKFPADTLTALLLGFQPKLDKPAVDGIMVFAGRDKRFDKNSPYYCLTHRCVLASAVRGTLEECGRSLKSRRANSAFTAAITQTTGGNDVTLDVEDWEGWRRSDSLASKAKKLLMVRTMQMLALLTEIEEKIEWLIFHKPRGSFIQTKRLIGIATTPPGDRSVEIPERPAQRYLPMSSTREFHQSTKSDGGILPSARALLETEAAERSLQPTDKRTLGAPFQNTVPEWVSETWGSDSSLQTDIAFLETSNEQGFLQKAIPQWSQWTEGGQTWRQYRDVSLTVRYVQLADAWHKTYFGQGVWWIYPGGKPYWLEFDGALQGQWVDYAQRQPQPSSGVKKTWAPSQQLTPVQVWNGNVLFSLAKLIKSFKAKRGDFMEGFLGIKESRDPADDIKFKMTMNKLQKFETLEHAQSEVVKLLPNELSDLSNDLRVHSSSSREEIYKAVLAVSTSAADGDAPIWTELEKIAKHLDDVHDKVRKANEILDAESKSGAKSAGEAYGVAQTSTNPRPSVGELEVQYVDCHLALHEELRKYHSWDSTNFMNRVLNQDEETLKSSVKRHEAVTEYHSATQRKLSAKELGRKKVALDDSQQKVETELGKLTQMLEAHKTHDTGEMFLTVDDVIQKFKCQLDEFKNSNEFKKSNSVEVLQKLLKLPTFFSTLPSGDPSDRWAEELRGKFAFFQGNFTLDMWLSRLKVLRAEFDKWTGSHDPSLKVFLKRPIGVAAALEKCVVAGERLDLVKSTFLTYHVADGISKMITGLSSVDSGSLARDIIGTGFETYQRDFRVEIVGRRNLREGFAIPRRASEL